MYRNQLWKKFQELSSGCYTNMIQPDADMSLWNDTFLVLMEMIHDGRSQNPNFAQELYQLDEITDFELDISGWLEDYLDTLDMRGHHDKLRLVCEKLIGLFQWEEESPSDFRFCIASALGAQGKDAQALAFCEDWYQKEPDNMLAATALIYARCKQKDLAGAEEIVDRYIYEDTVCTDENDVLFMAAADLYQVSGNKKAQKRVKQALKTYEEELNRYLTEEDIDFDSFDDVLPFD